jgi:uncharacterized protein (TIGR02996 family)
MSEREAFLQAILDAPADDAPRLIYADWLEDHGEAAHAELIRVQCELARPPAAGARARRDGLRRREEELLALPQLWLPGAGHGYKYARGFVDSYFVCDECDPGGAGEGPPVAAPNLPLDRVLSICLSFGQGASPDEGYMARLAAAPWLGRVTGIQIFESRFGPGPLRALAASAHLTHLSEVAVTDAHVSAEAIPDLVLAPAARGVRSLEVCGAFTRGEQVADIRVMNHRLVNEAFARIAASPKAAALERLVIDARGLGEAGARAILESPHLGRLRELHLGRVDLGRPLRRALRTRFGAGVEICGPDGYLVAN